MSRVNNIKLMIEVDVFCANDEPPPTHLILRYFRDNMPKMCMKGDLDRHDSFIRKRAWTAALDGGSLEGAMNALDERDDWDHYTVHFTNKIRVVES